MAPWLPFPPALNGCVKSNKKIRIKGPLGSAFSHTAGFSVWTVVKLDFLPLLDAPASHPAVSAAVRKGLDATTSHPAVAAAVRKWLDSPTSHAAVPKD